MADFLPKFVDLVRNYTTSVGTGDFKLGPVVNGYTGFAAVCQIGDRFYYSAIGVDKPTEREVGRGTLLAGGIIGREPIGGAKTDFSSGTKSIALIAAAEWFEAAHDLVASVTPLGQSLASASSTAQARTALGLDASVPANVKWFGVTGDGATDDTAALNAAFAAADHLHIPAGTYIVSSLVIPAGKTITTAGFDTIVKQKSGTAANTRIVQIAGSNVALGDIAVEGQLNQVGDTTGEQNHAVFVYSTASDIANVTVGNVRATNIRGDAVYVGMGGGHFVTQAKIGQIYANNCWRNGLSVVDGVRGLDVESVVEIACGQHTVDFEPDASTAISGVRIGYVRGRHIQFAGTNGPVDGVDIGVADLDLSYGANSTPANPVDHKMASQAAGTDNGIVLIGTVSAHIERAAINGYTGQAVIGSGSGPKLSIGSLAITNCCTSDTVYNSFIQSMPTSLRIGTLSATTTLSTHRVFDSCSNAQVGKATVALVTGSSYMQSCTDCRTDELVMTVSGAGNGGKACISGTRCFFGGGVQAGDYLFSFCTRCVAVGVDATMTSSYDNSGTANAIVASNIGGAYKVVQLSGGATSIGDGSVQVNNTGNSIAALNGADFSLWGAGAYKIAGATLIDASRNASFANLTSTTTLGYATGAGGTVTQATSKSTGVTLNKACGAITMNAAALAAAAVVEFTVTNSTVAATDTININLKSGATTSTAYRYWISGVAAGSFKVCVENRSAGSLSEALAFNFAVIKAVAA
jgi:hypothetical protein